jgi:hypothetical protein
VEAGAEEAAATTAAAEAADSGAAATPVAVGAAGGVAKNIGSGRGPAVGHGETALAEEGGTADLSAAAATATGNDQRRVVWADHESSAATAKGQVIGTRAADRDLQDLACSQDEIATDLGAETTCASYNEGAASALRAKGKDLIETGFRHRVGDELTGIREVDPLIARIDPAQLT